MDYRKILLTYINHVGEQEGTTFIGGAYSLDNLTPEENAELVRLDEESRDVSRSSQL